jgi:hypothetical protein
VPWYEVWHTQHIHSIHYVCVKPPKSLPLLFGLNLLLSRRFYELAGHYPEHVTVVSYNLKKDRFQVGRMLQKAFQQYHITAHMI